MTLIQQIDFHLANLKVPFPWRRIIRAIQFGMISGIFYGPFALYVVYCFDHNIREPFLLFLPYFILKMPMFFFMGATIVLIIKLVRLNRAVTVNILKISSASKNSDQFLALSHCIQAHFKVFYCTETLAKMYGFAMLGNIILSLVSMFLLIMTFLHVNQHQRNFYILEMAFDFVPIVVIGMLMDRLRNEVNLFQFSLQFL